jgi:hypothetical protein
MLINVANDALFIKENFYSMVEDGYDVVAYDSQLYEENVGIQKM